MLHDRRHGVCLHCEVNLDLGGESCAQFLHFARHHGAVVCVKGSPAELRRDGGDLAAADEQFAVLRVEVRVRSVLREGVEHCYCGTKTVLNWAARAGRSNLPLGLRGSSGSHATW